MVLNATEMLIFSTKDLVASCKPKNNVTIVGIKPNNMKR